MQLLNFLLVLNIDKSRGTKPPSFKLCIIGYIMSITESDERLVAWNVSGMLESVVALIFKVGPWGRATLNVMPQHC